MARSFGLVGLVAAGLLLTGCVPIERYKALELQSRTDAERASKASAEAMAAKQKADALQAQLDAYNNNSGNLAGLVKNQQDLLTAKDSEIAELNKRYAEAMSKVGTAGTALPAPLSNELSAFAAANPDLIDFDAAHGTVKFKSDVTFAVGDATLTAKAKEVIARFATILNSPAASGYELLVAGHTDNSPVSNPATIQRGHKNNWYLSAHRAISVGDELVAQHVGAQRLGVVGYADQRPIASNANDAGKAQNRRVEVVILPTQVRSGAVTPAPAVAPKLEGNKDAGAVIAPKPPVNNKDAGIVAPPATDNK